MSPTGTAYLRASRTHAQPLPNLREILAAHASVMLRAEHERHPQVEHVCKN